MSPASITTTHGLSGTPPTASTQVETTTDHSLRQLEDMLTELLRGEGMLTVFSQNGLEEHPRTLVRAPNAGSLSFHVAPPEGSKPPAWGSLYDGPLHDPAGGLTDAKSWLNKFSSYLAARFSSESADAKASIVVGDIGGYTVVHIESFHSSRETSGVADSDHMEVDRVGSSEPTSPAVVFTFAPRCKDAVTELQTLLKGKVSDTGTQMYTLLYLNPASGKVHAIEYFLGTGLSKEPRDYEDAYFVSRMLHLLYHAVELPRETIPKTGETHLSDVKLKFGAGDFDICVESKERFVSDVRYTEMIWVKAIRDE